MRFQINLASQPYQDAQRFLMRWGLAIGVAAIITVGLVFSAAIAIHSWRSTTKEIRSLKQQIAELDGKKEGAKKLLDRPENRSTRDHSDFLNYLFARKALSWTEVFVDLEKLMPSRLHVTAIRPTINEQGAVELHLSVVGATRDSAAELVRRLEQSPHFSHAEIVSENTNALQSGQPGVVQCEISAIYISPFKRVETPDSAQPQNSAASGPVSSKGEGSEEARNAQR